MSNAKGRKSELRTFPPPPRGFELFTASKRELIHHGIPQKPDARTDPGLASLWEQRARRYTNFEHLKPELIDPEAEVAIDPGTSSFGLSHFESAGFELFSPSAPITIFTGTWTVPNIVHTQTVNHQLNFQTFFGLGFLDVHVEMTVDTSDEVSALVRIQTGQQVAIPIHPGDLMSATLCLQTDSDGTAFIGLVNETVGQTVNFTLDTGFPPATTINAGISRGSEVSGPPDPLAQFGAVYFDDLLGFSTGGARVLTNGEATTMVGINGAKLATPYRLTEYAFKVVCES